MWTAITIALAALAAGILGELPGVAFPVFIASYMSGRNVTTDDAEGFAGWVFGLGLLGMAASFFTGA